MKLALLQCNYTVGDLAGNAEKLREAAVRAQVAGAELAVASELAITGYPPRDLLERPGFVTRAAAVTQRLVQNAPEIPLLFGTVAATEGRLENQAVLAFGGRVLARASKQLLPNYDVFDEQRHFRPGKELCFVEVAGRRLAVSICEDAWAEAQGTKGRYVHDPLGPLKEQRAAMLVNLSASPFTVTKRHARERIFADVARRFGLPVAMVNQVGANDELVFDGSSVVFASDGNVVARARAFSEDLLLWDEHGEHRVEPLADRDEEAAYQALVLGVRDYARKCGFQGAVLGLSGGIDSALVATIACDALGPEHVLGVAMPSRYSSPGSLADARALAQNLGMPFRVISIDEMFQAAIEQLSAPLEELKPAGPSDVTWENIQARLRGSIVMAISNRTSALALTTGNKSELAVGYCTLYGDMVGGLAVISDVPKTMVYKLARWVNERGERIPQSSIDKAPSAELRPDQTDQDSLPPYDVLDAILERYVERQQSADSIVRDGFDRATVERVVRMIVLAEYKRRQAAPGIIISEKAFGSGRRLPIARVFELSSD